MYRVELSIMPEDKWKIGDYVYIVNKIGTSILGAGGINYKKKLTIQEVINLKFLSFEKVCVDAIRSPKSIYKIIKINEDNKLTCEETNFDK